MSAAKTSEAEAAREVLQVVMLWVVSPIVETGKSLGDKMDRMSAALERIADGIDRASPPKG